MPSCQQSSGVVLAIGEQEIGESAWVDGIVVRERVGRRCGGADEASGPNAAINVGRSSSSSGGGNDNSRRRARGCDKDVTKDGEGLVAAQAGEMANVS
jgi:hypothetical protein